MSTIPSHVQASLVLGPSDPASPLATPFVMPPLLRGPTALEQPAAPEAWLWDGFLAAGAVTLLTSRWKAGKTTLVAVLLARMKSGGLFAGRPLAAGRAVVVTEEASHHWQRRHAQLHFADHIGWFCRPFRGKPNLPDWSAFVDGLVEMHRDDPFSLPCFTGQVFRFTRACQAAHSLRISLDGPLIS